MYLLFDIGGTKIRIAASEGESIGESVILETPRDFEEVVHLLTTQGKILAKNREIQAVCGGSRGVLDHNKSFLTDRSFFGWIDKPFKDKLQDAFDTPIFLENDAALAGLGEAISGAGKNYDIVAFLTISTGIGGTRIVKQKIDANSAGFEPGNQIINKTTGLTWEKDMGGETLEKKYHSKPENIKDPAVWEKVAESLATGLNNIAVLWSPNVIVLGGGLMNSIPLERVKFHLGQTLKIFPKIPEVVKAELGDSAGLYGALEYLKQQLS